MSPELEKYMYMGIVAFASICFWYFSQPNPELASWKTQEERMHLPSVSPVEPVQSEQQLRNLFKYISEVPVELSTASGKKEEKGKKKEAGISSPAQIPQFEINGIIFDGHENLVNIDGKFYTQGESYKDIKIIEIYPDKVRFGFDDRIVEKNLSVPTIGMIEGS